MKLSAALSSAIFSFLATTSVFGFCANTYAQDATIPSVSSVPVDQSNRIEQDIQAMKKMSFAQSDPELLKLMELTDATPNLTPDTLLNWMEARVHFFVDENFDLKTAVSLAQKNYAFPNPGVFPDETSPDETSDEDVSSGGDTIQVMTNIGAGIYESSKTLKDLVQINLPGIAVVPVTSPRIGLVRLGSGLFSQLYDDPSLSIDSKPYIAYRLSVLFHEARHSDGNGKSLGFFHAICPSGTFAGKAACDRNLNGPYQIQAKFLLSLISSCTDCSDGDTQAMQLIEADSASRQIRGDESQDRTVRDLQTTLATCQLMQNLNSKVALGGEECSDVEGLKSQIAKLQNISEKPSTASTWWDATPEGTFLTP
jgi:hypothetical protein